MSIDIPTLLVTHGGTPPPHHLEVDAPDGVYHGVRVTGGRAVVAGGAIRTLAAALPGRVRVLAPVTPTGRPAAAPPPPADDAAPAQVAPTPAEAVEATQGARKRKRPADPAPQLAPLDDDW